MYSNFSTYVPFQHDNLEQVNGLINFARTQDRTKPEAVLAATMIYTNLADYLLRHLLDNLRRMVSISNYRLFNAVFCFDPSKDKLELSLGALIVELQSFSFPDKESFLKEAAIFNQSRNAVMHNLLKSDLSNIDSQLEKVARGAEELLAKYNIIISGMTAIWLSVYPPVPQQPTSATDGVSDKQKADDAAKE